MKNCIIIGGGIIGLSSAYFLAKEGHQVTIIDKGDMNDGCSFGNAGMIVPSHLIPFAQPGMMAQGLKWMFDSKSPFYVQPRLSMDLFKWGLKFYKTATADHVQKSMPVLRDLSLFSKGLYQDWAAKDSSFMYEEKGLLMLYKSEKVGEETSHEGKEAQKMGLEVDFLSKSELLNVETGVETTAIGGVHYKSDSHLSPNKLISFLKSELEKLNVKLLPNSEVTDFKITNNSISEVITKKGNYKADEIIIATGSWSPQLATKLGINVSILPGKGYSFTLKNRSEKPAIPSILCEGKVAVTPMGNDLRFGGTMEITHTNDTKINMNRMEGIINTIHSFYPTLEVNTPQKEDIWFGFRPCTSSGLPIISRSRKHSNVIIATGHGMMGLSLAPATGKLVEELISVKKASVSIDILTY